MRSYTLSSTIRFALLVWFTGCCIAVGQGGPRAPLIFGNTQPIVNEYGNTLAGSSVTRTGDLVHIYRIESGSILPPDIHGNPKPSNVLIPEGISFIGSTVRPDWTDSGLFGHLIVSNQPPAGTRLFVRVFNAPDLASASFYGDSPEFSLLSDEDRYPIEVPAADIPLDTTDPSGIGFHNSWQKSLGPDPYNTDSDGDGMTDFEEWLAGTNPFDPNSLLRVEEIWWPDEDEMAIVWQSVIGRCYFIEFSSDLVPGPDSFVPLHDQPFQATEQPLSSMFMDSVDFGIFRVRLVPCE